jgi:hypothetical protein
VKNPAQHLIAEVPRRQAKVEIAIGIDLGDVWSHYCTLNQDGEGLFSRLAKQPERIPRHFSATSQAECGAQSKHRYLCQVESSIRARGRSSCLACLDERFRNHLFRFPSFSLSVKFRAAEAYTDAESEFFILPAQTSRAKLQATHPPLPAE